MSNIFFWLNDNSGFLTFLTVLASLITCIFSLCSARAAWAQVKEMRRQFQEENRPNIEIEFLYEKRTYYGLRFVNQGKCTAQNVRIHLEDTFINALPEYTFLNLLRKSSQKTCVIGVGQHYDLFIGTREYRDCPNKPPAKGKILYQANGQTYESEFDIDMENYATIFSVQSEQEDLLEKLKAQNSELKEIKEAIQSLKKVEGEDSSDKRTDELEALVKV